MLKRWKTTFFQRGHTGNVLPTLNKLIIQMVLHLFGNTFDRAPWKVVGYFITATFLLCMFLSAIYALQKIYFNTGKDSTITGYLGHLYYCSEASLILSDTPSRSVICQEWCLHSGNCGKSVKAGGIWPELAPGLGLEPSLQAELSFPSAHHESRIGSQWMQGKKQGRKFLLINENFDLMILCSEVLSNTSRICWTASREFKVTTQVASDRSRKAPNTWFTVTARKPQSQLRPRQLLGTLGLPQLCLP